MGFGPLRCRCSDRSFSVRKVRLIGGMSGSVSCVHTVSVGGAVVSF